MEPLIAEIERSYAEIEQQLGDPELIADQRRYAERCPPAQARLPTRTSWRCAGAS